MVSSSTSFTSFRWSTPSFHSGSGHGTRRRDPLRVPAPLSSCSLLCCGRDTGRAGRPEQLPSAGWEQQPLGEEEQHKDVCFFCYDAVSKIKKREKHIIQEGLPAITVESEPAGAAAVVSTEEEKKKRSGCGVQFQVSGLTFLLLRGKESRKRHQSWNEWIKSKIKECRSYLQLLWWLLVWEGLSKVPYLMLNKNMTRWQREISGYELAAAQLQYRSRTVCNHSKNKSVTKRTHHLSQTRLCVRRGL